MALVDLFSGCGGFSLGAHQAGFRVAAAFDIDPTLTFAFRSNFPRTRLILADVSKLDGAMLVSAAGGQVDGILGGPPCQGFSVIGRRALDDPRSLLVGHFFRLVREVEPSFFVMENVRGLSSPRSSDVLDNALKLIEDRYAILGPEILDAADFGAPTRRQRLFLIGIHKDKGERTGLDAIAKFRRPPATVRAAIADLENPAYVGEDAGFEVWRISHGGRPSDYARTLREPDGRFTGHTVTEHSRSVVRRFKSVPPGGTDPVGRHQRLDWLGQCPTLRAGTGPDRGSYQSVRPLHPQEHRVITVREAARLQGFPDGHRFHPTTWHSFRMIGNSVSPIIAGAILKAIAETLDGCPANGSKTERASNGPSLTPAAFLADVPSQGEEYISRG